MSSADKGEDRTMGDILASIRRIIAQDPDPTPRAVAGPPAEASTSGSVELPAPRLPMPPVRPAAPTTAELQKPQPDPQLRGALPQAPTQAIPKSQSGTLGLEDIVAMTARAAPVARAPVLPTLEPTPVAGAAPASSDESAWKREVPLPPSLDRPAAARDDGPEAPPEPPAGERPASPLSWLFPRPFPSATKPALEHPTEPNLPGPAAARPEAAKPSLVAVEAQVPGSIPTEIAARTDAPVQLGGAREASKPATWEPSLSVPMLPPLAAFGSPVPSPPSSPPTEAAGRTPPAPVASGNGHDGLGRGGLASTDSPASKQVGARIDDSVRTEIMVPAAPPAAPTMIAHPAIAGRPPEATRAAEPTLTPTVAKEPAAVRPFVPEPVSIVAPAPPARREANPLSAPRGVSREPPRTTSPIPPAERERAPAALPLSEAPSAAMPPARSLEDTVTDLLRPLIRDWLDENLPRLIEPALKLELEARKTRRDGGEKS